MLYKIATAIKTSSIQIQRPDLRGLRPLQPQLRGYFLLHSNTKTRFKGIKTFKR